MRSDRLLAVGVLCAIVAFGAYVRLADIGRPALSHDELIHYFTAQSLERGDGPLLPSGEEYRRGIDLTRLSGLGARLVADTETGLRLPSALFGVLNLIVFAAVAWMIGGPWAAVIGTLLLAIYPEAVARSRGVRFYTYQLNFGLIALYAVWQVLRRSAATRDQLRRSWIWGLIAVIAFALAARVQITTLSVVAGAGVAFLTLAALDLRRHGRSAWRASAAVQCAAVVLALGVLVLLIAPHLVRELAVQSQHQPLWARSNEGSVLAYYRMLADTFPLLLGLAPLIFVAVGMRDVRLALLLACWFGVPFLLHSVVFPWKGERFILMAMPGLFLATAIAVAMAGERLRAAVVSRVAGFSGRVLGLVTVAVIVLFAVAATPALHRVRKMPSGASEPMVRRERWSDAASIIRSIPGGDTLPIGSSTPLAAMHYIGRADFAVRLDALERPVGTLAMATSGVQSQDGVPLSYGRFADGSPDFYAGVPVLTMPVSIQRRFATRGQVIVVIDSTRWIYGDIEPALKRILEREATDLCRGKCGALMAFHWAWSGKSSDSTP